MKHTSAILLLPKLKILAFKHHLMHWPAPSGKHTWASQKVQGGPSEIFIAMGGFLGGEGPLFGTFQGGPPPLAPPVLTYD